MTFGVVIDRFPRQQLLSFAPQVNRDQLLICKLGTIIVTQALQFFPKSGIIALTNGAIQFDEFFFHTVILIFFASFVYIFSQFFSLPDFFYY